MSATLTVAAMQPAGQQRMADLAAEERHGFRGPDRDAHHRAGGAVDAARQIDRKDRHGAAFIASIMARATPSTGRSRPAPNSASTTTSAGIRRPASAARWARSSAGRPAPASPLSRCTVADEQQPDPVPALRQQAGGDEAVAAVVAGAGHDGDARARRMPRRDARRRPPARRFPSARCRRRRPRSSGGRPRPSRRW